MKILDATCGYKGMWYQKNHPYVTFMDKRKGVYDSKEQNVKFRNRRRVKINPDVVSEWKDAPFPNDYFDMVIFDPPHHLSKSKNSFLTVYYGSLNKNSWKHDIKEGVEKLFNLLKPDGIFIFKWCEVDIKANELLKLFPYKPLFGNIKNGTCWIVFIKYRPEKPFTNKLLQSKEK